MLFAPTTAWRVRWNMNTDTPLPPEESAGQNPPDGAILDWWLPAWLPLLPASWSPWLLEIHDFRSMILLLGALIPLALTMTLLWKAKETIMAGVFRGSGSAPRIV